jgi:hypothetical protein
MASKTMCTKAPMLDECDEIIASILIELDREQATYQKTYRKLYGMADEQAHLTYQLMVGLCERIRKEIMSLERK